MYLRHLSPTSGTAKAIARSIVYFVTKKNISQIN